MKILPLAQKKKDRWKKKKKKCCAKAQKIAWKYISKKKSKKEKGNIY